nr:uncharacterized protein LOC109171395 [Ipomoea batatas]
MSCVFRLVSSLLRFDSALCGSVLLQFRVRGSSMVSGDDLRSKSRRCPPVFGGAEYRLASVKSDEHQANAARHRIRVTFKSTYFGRLITVQESAPGRSSNAPIPFVLARVPSLLRELVVDAACQAGVTRELFFIRTAHLSSRVKLGWQWLITGNYTTYDGPTRDVLSTAVLEVELHLSLILIYHLEYIIDLNTLGSSILNECDLEEHEGGVEVVTYDEVTLKKNALRNIRNIVSMLVLVEIFKRAIKMDSPNLSGEPLCFPDYSFAPRLHPTFAALDRDLVIIACAATDPQRRFSRPPMREQDRLLIRCRGRFVEISLAPSCLRESISESIVTSDQEFSVLMPGEEMPTFIAHLAPISCPPNRDPRLPYERNEDPTPR